MAKKTSTKKATKKTSKKAATKKVVKKTTKKVAKKAAKKVTKTAAKKVEKKQTKTTSKPQQKTKTVTPHVTSLKPGMPAPYFEGLDQNGNKITSNDLLGRKVILYFYPKDDTPGCTKEACNLRDNYQRLVDAGYVIYGVSADSTASHQKFIQKYNLPFSLIADPDKNIIRAFDVWGKKLFMGKVSEGIVRTTFVIDENGIISNVITKVEVANHADQILNH